MMVASIPQTSKRPLKFSNFQDDEKSSEVQIKELENFFSKSDSTPHKVCDPNQEGKPASQSVRSAEEENIKGKLDVNLCEPWSCEKTIGQLRSKQA